MDPTSAEARHLIAFIERVENVNEEIKEKQEDRKEIFKEAKSTGYSVPIIKEIVRLRAMDPDKRHETESMLDLYMSAVGLE